MEVVDACLLLDFYGQLLTDRTRMILELHFSEDMSLTEIAEQESITRQAVHDTIRRGLRTPQEYEDKLQLIRRFNVQKTKVREAAVSLSNQNNDEALRLLTELLEQL